MVPAFFRVSLQRFFWLLCAYSLTRLFFLLWNWPLFEHDSAGELVYAFFFGLRFDTAAILLTNAPLLALWMLPTRWFENRWMRGLELALFAAVNFVALGGNVGDAEFVKFIGKRTPFDLLFIHEDVERQSLSILATYWHLFAGLILLTVAVAWLSARFPRGTKPEGWVSGALWRLAYSALIVLSVRGFGFKPLNPMQAYFNTHRETGLLTLNTPFNIIKTRPSGPIERARYFATDREAILQLREMTDLSRPPLGTLKGWNVVVLIMESFGSEYTGAANDYKGYTPFFDELAKKSIYFKRNFSNARRSIEGIPAVLCALPNIMDEPIITSDFSSDRLDCLPKVLGPAGYSTYFLHGAHNGSMHFDSFARLAGFEKFVGLDEYPYKDIPENLDGYWGVLDEPMLQYAAEVIDQAPKPVFLGLFSLSSHHPYFIPEKYRGKFPKGTLEIHESIGYADFALRQFFNTAATKPWFNKTIFVITADHTQKSDHKEYQNPRGAYRVPLLIYVPGLKPGTLRTDPDRITQHIDVMPSLLDLLGLDRKDRLLVGQSVFDLAKPGRAYNYNTGNYWYMEPGLYVEVSRPPVQVRAFTQSTTWDLKEHEASDPMFAKAIQNIEAVVHYLNAGLVGNSLYTWRDSL
jgi:phosphoglycerol transferase MdoB-like AlkP superfamily enzyme